MLYNISWLSALLGIASTAHAVTLTVSTAQGNATSPILYGLLYEVCNRKWPAERLQTDCS